MISWFKVKSYFNWRIKAKGLHSLHSSALFRFYNEVVAETLPFYAFESLRLVTLSYLTQRQINEKAKSRIALNEMLFRAVNLLGPKRLLIIGPHQNDRSLYAGTASPQLQITLLTHKEADLDFNWFKKRGLKIPKPIASISELEQSSKLDMVFFGESADPQFVYNSFQQIKPLLSPSAILIFSGCYRNETMFRLWEGIKADEACNLTLDFYDSCYVFTEKSRARQHMLLNGPGKKRIPYFDY